MDAVDGRPGRKPGPVSYRLKLTAPAAAGLVMAGLMLAAAGPPPVAVPAPGGQPLAPSGPASETDRAWAFRYAPCVDSKVAPLVGKAKEAALAQVKTMNLRAVRLLYPSTTVTYEVAPQRLTLVIDDRGVVTRAFCR